jgi:hypothetical protein
VAKRHVRESAKSKESSRTIWITDAHRGDGKHFVVRAKEKLAAFLDEIVLCSKGSALLFCLSERRQPVCC